MVFSSLTFIFVFLPTFLIIYYLSPQKIRNLILLIFSLIFYAWGELKYLPLLIFSSLINYISGLLIYKCKSKKKKYILLFSILIDVGLLIIFKYSNFIINNINNLLNLNIHINNIDLPLGISFFTFQTMSYTIDVYTNIFKPEKNFINFLTYVTMFPQLVAGPIVRYDEIKNDLYSRKCNFSSFYNGLFIFVVGLIKKVLLANNLGYLFNLIFQNLASASWLTAWLGLVSYTLQIYFDFSGYSDMAIGLGKMMGFDYPNNFNYPYISKSITDFWRRWHITLSSWFKSYVYIPLGGNRCSKLINVRNIMIVWLLTGIWHGASWNFLIWGCYFGIILIFEKFFFKNFLQKIPSFFQHIYSLFLIMIGWLIFSINTLDEFKLFFSKLFFNKYIIDDYFLLYLKNYYIFIIIGIIASTPIVKKLYQYKALKFIYCIFICCLFLISISYLISDTYNPFLYFRF